MTQWKPQKNGLIYITFYISNRNAWNFHRIFVCCASIRVPSLITVRCIIMKISTTMSLAKKHDTRCINSLNVTWSFGVCCWWLIKTFKSDTWACNTNFLLEANMISRFFSLFLISDRQQAIAKDWSTLLFEACFCPWPTQYWQDFCMSQMQPLSL